MNKEFRFNQEKISGVMVNLNGYNELFEKIMSKDKICSIEVEKIKQD